MAELGFITPASEKVALAHPPRIVAQAGNGSINYVADWVMDAINDVLGHVDEDIVVRTTIDSGLQASAEKALTEELAQKGDKNGVSQGALVAMTPDGAVRAMVGGRNYAESQFNRAVAAKRQPGSAFKPFVYLTALEHGLTPDSVRDDEPIKIKGWQPENYGHEYYGPVTLTKALALSLNTVSVRLTMEFTPTAVIRTAYRLGIASKLEPNASIALGTSEVSPLELVGAYAPFANGGLAVVPHVIERITAGNGKVLYARNEQPLGRIVEARYVAMMNEMMQQTLTIGTAHKAALPGWPAAGKTGTSQDFRDAWFIGYTAHLVTGVWLGNDDGTPTKKVTGGGLPVEIWSRFMRGAHQGVPVAALPGPPAGGMFSGLFSGNAPAPQRTAARRCRRRRSNRPAIRRPRAAPASTAGCSTICSGPALKLVLTRFHQRTGIHLAENVWIIQCCVAARARSARVKIQIAKRRAAHRRHRAGQRPGAGAEQRSDHRPAQRRRTLLHEAEQRGGRAGPLRKRRHGAGDRLRQHHAETGEIERHRQHQRGGRGQARAQPPSPYPARRPPSPPRRRRACASSAVPHHQPRRQRRADHVADRADREGDAELERREAVEILQHEGRAGNPGEQSGKAGRGEAEISEIGADCAPPRDRT